MKVTKPSEICNKDDCLHARWVNLDVYRHPKKIETEVTENYFLVRANVKDSACAMSESVMLAI